MSSNEPSEFELTPENFFDELLMWLPDQFHKMRQYQSGKISIQTRIGVAIECCYMQTVGGEKFRVYNADELYGEFSSEYLAPLGQDDDIVVAMASRLDEDFRIKRRANELTKGRSFKDIVATMRFHPGPFEPK